MAAKEIKYGAKAREKMMKITAPVAGEVSAQAWNDIENICKSIPIKHKDCKNLYSAVFAAR